jgi:hypothetical protein
MPVHRLARYLMKATGLGVHLQDAPVLVQVPTADSTKRMQPVLTQVQSNCFRSFERPSFQHWSAALPGVGPA